MPGILRLFLASSFPEPLIRDLNDRIGAVRSRLPAASWVRPDAQHLTYAFLGNRPEPLVETLTPPLTEALGAVPRFRAALHGSGFFPNSRHARVGWVGLDPEDKFFSVAQVVREVVTTNGVELDGVDFRPHLTLMRIRDPWPPSSIDLFARTLHDYRSEPFEVDEVTLYSSRLHPKGAIHTPVQTFHLSS